MKKNLLILVSVLCVTLVNAQITVKSSFEGDALPEEWTTIDYGHNTGTWELSDSYPYSGEMHLRIDCYEGDSTASGQPDDYLVLPKFTVKEGDVVSFWAVSGNDSYQDGFKLLVSKTDMDTSNFDYILGDVAEVPYDYEKYEYVLTEHADISAGDEVYIALYCNTNGSSLLVDDLRVGPASIQDSISESFSTEIPADWTVLDYGHNPSTWAHDTYDPYMTAGHVALDCYDGDSTASGQAEDYLITPLILVSENEIVSFYAKSDDDTYLDGFKLFASVTGKDSSDFDIEIADVAEVPNEYTAYSYDLTAHADISAGDEIYLAVYCNTNGSWLFIDEFKVEPASGDFPDVIFSEDFEGGFPTGWDTLNYGTNDEAGGTWGIDSTRGLDGSLALLLDTYSGTGGAADDWLITDKFPVVDDYILSFWLFGNGQYPDTVDVAISKDGKGTTDFTMLLLEDLSTPGDYTKYQFVLSDSTSLSEGDSVYLAFHCASNGSRVVLDEVRYGKYVAPVFDKAYAMSNNSITIQYDAPVDADSLDVADFHLLGSDDITFTTLEVDAVNPKLVHLSGSMQSTIDTIIDFVVDASAEDTSMFYAGILPLSYANVTNPTGTIDIEGHSATFKAIVMEMNEGGDRVFVADDSTARHGAIVYGGTFFESVDTIGDEILFYGFFSPWDSQTEIIDATLIKTISKDNELYKSVVINGSDIDGTIAPETDPAEQYEGVLVTIKNATVTADFDGAYFTMSDDGETTSFYIGENSRYDIFDGTFDETVMIVGTSYDITGYVIGRGGENYFLTPRSVADITVATSVREELTQELLIYPNPTNNNLYIKNSASITEIEILSISGQVILRKIADNVEMISLDIYSLKKGMYVLKLIDEAGNTVTRKFTKK